MPTSEHNSSNNGVSWRSTANDARGAIMNEKRIIAAKGIAGAINEPVWTIWKIVQVFEDASLQDMSIETALERFHEVVQKCQDIERMLSEQLPALEKLAHKQE
jgi:hypothetical protein